MVDGPKGVPPEETQRIYRRNARIGVSIKAMADAERDRTERNAKKHMRHFGPFRDGHNILRMPNGRFATETAPKHKRPKRLPFANKEEHS